MGHLHVLCNRSKVQFLLQWRFGLQVRVFNWFSPFETEASNEFFSKKKVRVM